METNQQNVSGINGITGTIPQATDLTGPFSNMKIGSSEWIGQAFGYNATNVGKFSGKFEAIEMKAKEFAGFLVNTLPDGIDRISALTKFREVILYATNSIVQHSNA